MARVYALVLMTSSSWLLLEVGSVNQQEAAARSVFFKIYFIIFFLARSLLTGLKSEVFRPPTV